MSMAVEPHPGMTQPARAVRGESFYARFLVTALSFFLFAPGALVVGLILMPLVRILPSSRDRKRARARAVMRVSLRLYVAIMAGLKGMTYEFRDAQRLGRAGQLIIANHPSLLDVVFLLAFVPGTGCVVKASLWRNLLTRGAVTLAEFVKNDPTAAMIESASAALTQGQTLIMFPEGTRTVPGRPFVFHRGAANIALRAATVVTPVYIRVYPTTLTKAEPWYRIPPLRPHFSLVVGDDIDLTSLRNLPLPSASRALNGHLQTHFQEKLAYLDGQSARVGDAIG
jgi:1-acyl-sn-glycerol-3-phosphate acyltransferase